MGDDLLLVSKEPKDKFQMVPDSSAVLYHSSLLVDIPFPGQVASAAMNQRGFAVNLATASTSE